MKRVACGWPEIREAGESKGEMNRPESRGRRIIESPESEGAEGRNPESERREGRNPRSREKSGARSTGKGKERPEPPGSKAEIRSPRAGVQARLRVGATWGGARKDPRRPCCAGRAAPPAVYLCPVPGAASFPILRSRSLLTLPPRRLCPHTPGHGSVAATPLCPRPVSALTAPALSAPAVSLQPRPPPPLLCAAME